MDLSFVRRHPGTFKLVDKFRLNVMVQLLWKNTDQRSVSYYLSYYLHIGYLKALYRPEASAPAVA